jgi:hypothetical protein
VIKKNALICISLFTSLIVLPGLASAQFVLPTPPQEAQKPEEAAPPPAAAETPAIPDDVRLILLIRNAVIALNQANETGNYTVLREMGTANFQMTNSSAKLAEVFAALRARKIDLSPVMVFNPKLSSAPALQDGQVLRLTGFFPTTPEQVHFDLAYQHNAGQWQLSGIAINVAPPSDEAQASLASPPAQAAPDQSAEGAKPGEAKPIRIDLSQPTPPPAKPAAHKKPAAAKKPKPPAQSADKTAAAQGAGAPPPAEAPAPAAKPAPPAASAESSSSWNPFGR